MRYVRIALSIIFLITIIILVVVFNFGSIKEYSKAKFGGIVSNKTSRSLQIIDDKEIKIIEAKKSSRESGIFDVDFILIEKPTEFNGKRYSDGVIKICDYTRLDVIEDKDVEVFRASNSSIICKLLNDFRWYETLDKAYE